jgi:hypothetical protein
MTGLASFQTLRRGLLALASLLLPLLSACALPPGQALQPIELTPPPRTIALPRVFFVERPDPFCQADIGDEFHWQLRRELERKGYRVLTAPAPRAENTNRPEALARAPAAEMLDLLPTGADALLRVTIDRYLALDLCSGEAIRTLEVAGTAELFAPRHDQPVWRHAAKAGSTSISRDEDLPFQVGAELARELLAPLPQAPAGPP